MQVQQPMRSSGRVRRLTLLLAVGTALIGLLLVSPDSRAGGSDGATALAVADSLRRAGRPDSAAVLLQTLARSARDRGDSLLFMDLNLQIGRLARYFGQASQAEPGLREALSMARARADTTRMLAALRWLSVAVELQGRGDEGRDLAKQLVELGEAAGDKRQAGWGRVGLAWHAIQSGRLEDAENLYGQSARLFDAAEDVEGALWSLLGLGLVRTRTGNLTAAVDAYERALQLARRHGERLTEAHALNDLAAIEFYLGDPVRALAEFERARSVHQDLGSLRETVRPMLNVALCLGELGRFEAAEDTLQAGLELCRRHGYRDLEPLVLTHLARLSVRRGRVHEAARRFQGILAAADLGELDPLSLRTRLQCLEGAAEALTALDSAATSLDLLAEARDLLREGGDAEMATRIGVCQAQALRALCRWEESLREAQLAAEAAVRRGQNEEAIEALIEASAAWRALGTPDSARTALARAAEIWERDRTRSLDPAWRERRGVMGPRIYTDLAMLMIAGSGPATDASATARSDASAHAAAIAGSDHQANIAASRDAAASAVGSVFDRLQAFKARTLLERISASGQPSDPREDDAGPRLISLADLQRRILRPGELFVDFYLGPDTSLVVAVNRDTAIVAGLPPRGALEPMLLYYHQLVSRPPADGREQLDRESIRRAGAVLGHRLFGDLEAMIAGSATIIVAPDGRIGLIPLAELRRHAGHTPGGQSASGQPSTLGGHSVSGQPSSLGGQSASAMPPMADATEWIQVPSASVFARAREAAAVALTRPPEILAVSGRHSPGGRQLHGCRREVREIERRFQHVSLLHAPTDSLALATGLYRADLLHFASHLVLNERHPWQSELRFSAPGAAANLRAASIATMRLPARLVVLSNCTSAGGQVLSGEGILGISSAFASAGVLTMVATLWPVDDRTTASLMLRFYDELSGGATVAAALGRAQAYVASRPETGHPFFWAGLVVIGDGDLRVELATRPGWRRLAAPSGAAILLLVLGAAMRRARLHPKRARPGT